MLGDPVAGEVVHAERHRAADIAAHLLAQRVVAVVGLAEAAEVHRDQPVEGVVAVVPVLGDAGGAALRGGVGRCCSNLSMGSKH